MCFSAEASFTAAGVLAVIGTVLVKKFHKDKKVLLSLIPFFFAMQQLSEGVLWIALTRNLYPNSWSLLTQVVYQFIAYIFWPIWIPLAFRYAEKQSWRKSILNILLILGSLSILKIGLTLASEGIVTPKIVQHSITYGESPQLFKLLYAIIVLVPFFISSLPNAGIVGLIIGITFFVASYFYAYAFASVWCFFAAVVSVSLFFLLKRKEKKIL
ncbi:MAG: hypothetical protein HKM07_02635 [Chlamydiae bacterium]|nr:hypothetical protein [Chlamydiota bacterium]